ncbi:restriction endonuclease subunit S [Hymenobacter sp. J193]|uniref:restriction endonuclease subunit S n=1 Tax=Hymenobacter sp. J193 TaxID=2898429 RepID=UPI0021508489|nr:restriction endonuclease subunit S [Hymenobacter sp. J193]MCR5886684.1 restriction endonuclease subunit S [Hymenobacter sp. J193]
MDTTQVPAGYKVTDLGVLPEEWDTSALSPLLSRRPDYGINAAAVGYSEALPTYLRITDISDNGELLTNNKVSVNHVFAENYILAPNDIVFARTGASTGKTYLHTEANGKLVFAGFLIRITTNPKKLDPRFLKAYTETSPYWKWVGMTSMRSGQPGINGVEYSKLQIPLPPLAEQQAIAAALGEMDALLAAQRARLAKQRAVKQGLLQGLLNEKKRLPGFTGEWEVKRLGDFTQIKTGKKNNEDKIEGGQYPFFVRSQKVESINSYSFDGEAILIPGEGGIGSIFHYINGKFDFHQRVYKISNFSPELSGKFVFYYMTLNFGVEATKNSVKATVDSLRLPTFKAFEITCPSADEQRAIAAVLSEADAYLAALEAEHAKTQQLKQGLMQQLLTGKLRLV